jgi:ankyrin repeat protein
MDGIDPDQQNGQGQTPFFCATMSGLRDTVRELLLTGRINLESRDSSGCTPLIWAARAGLTEIMHDMLLTCEKLLLVNPQARILNPSGAEYVRVDGKTIYIQNKDLV